MSQMSQIRSLYRALFRRSANIYASKLRFAVVWLGQIHNLDTGHVLAMLALFSNPQPTLHMSPERCLLVSPSKSGVVESLPPAALGAYCSAAHLQ